MNSSISFMLFPSPPPPSTVDSSSLIIADNFSHLNAPMPEPTEDQDSYDLPPLPDLLSIELPPPPPIIAGDLVFRYSSPLPSPPPLASRNSTRASTSSSSSSETARRRRSKISDRMKVLASLMPWSSGTRMSMATLLEEVIKYVKFLEAQVAALETMPVRSDSTGPDGVRIGRFGGLERVNRQQLLEVMVNSAGVQNVLYEKGFCLVFAEQVGLSSGGLR